MNHNDEIDADTTEQLRVRRHSSKLGDELMAEMHNPQRRLYKLPEIKSVRGSPERSGQKMKVK